MLEIMGANFKFLSVSNNSLRTSRGEIKKSLFFSDLNSLCG